MTDIFDNLSGVQLSAATTAQLDSTASKGYIDRSNRRDWMALADVALAMANARTYAHGLSIPEAGAVDVTTISDSSSVTVKPSGTELWTIHGIEAITSSSTSNAQVHLFDGTSTVRLVNITADTNGVQYIPTQPLIISNTLYLAVMNAGAEIDFKVAYSKVSL